MVINRDLFQIANRLYKMDYGYWMELLGQICEKLVQVTQFTHIFPENHMWETSQILSLLTKGSLGLPLQKRII